MEHFIGPPLAGAFAELTDREESDPIVAACITTYRRRYAVESLRLTVAVPGIDSALMDLDSLHDLAWQPRSRRRSPSRCWGRSD